MEFSAQIPLSYQVIKDFGISGVNLILKSLGYWQWKKNFKFMFSNL